MDEGGWRRKEDELCAFVGGGGFIPLAFSASSFPRPLRGKGPLLAMVPHPIPIPIPFPFHPIFRIHPHFVPAGNLAFPEGWQEKSMNGLAFSSLYLLPIQFPMALGPILPKSILRPEFQFFFLILFQNSAFFPS
jgi:hypothetical protein